MAERVALVLLPELERIVREANGASPQPHEQVRLLAERRAVPFDVDQPASAFSLVTARRNASGKGLARRSTRCGARGFAVRRVRARRSSSTSWS